MQRLCVTIYSHNDLCEVKREFARKFVYNADEVQVILGKGNCTYVFTDLRREPAIRAWLGAWIAGGRPHLDGALVRYDSADLEEGV